VSEEYVRKLIERKPDVYMMVGDIDKPFCRPECECEACECWRKNKGRPTHKELRERSRDGDPGV
jgi:hypothetical protein